MKPLKKKKKIKIVKPVAKKVKPVELPPAVIAHSKPTMGRQEEQAAAKVIHSATVGLGYEIAKFEYEFCRYLGLPEGHAVALSSGTAARYLALVALDAKDKTVATSAYSSGIINAIALIGGKCQLIDIDEAPAINMSALAASSAEIAFIPHMFGLPVAAESIEALKLSGKKVIEECSHALGARSGATSRPVGLAGDLAVYSFGADKIITTGGQGGMLVATDKDIADKVREMRDHHGGGHFNFALTDMQAAMGRVQLDKLDKLMARREDIYEAYKEAGFDLIDIPGAKVARHGAVMRSKNAAAVIAYLKAACVECICPVDELTAEQAKVAPKAAQLASESVSLPIYPHLSNDEVREIIDQVIDALED